MHGRFKNENLYNVVPSGARFLFRAPVLNDIVKIKPKNKRKRYIGRIIEQRFRFNQHCNKFIVLVSIKLRFDFKISKDKTMILILQVYVRYKSESTRKLPVFRRF